MTETLVLILAAGQSARWAGQVKQLARLWDGETVLSRMIRQVCDSGLEPWLITNDERLIEAVDGCVFRPGMSGSVFETFLSTRAFWDEHTSVLLGDVVFTDETMAKVLEPCEGLRIFTNPGETYALSFGEAVHDQLAGALTTQAARSAAGGIGSLKGMRELVGPSEWVLVNDLTDDVDSVDKYMLILARWGKLEEVR